MGAGHADEESDSSEDMDHDYNVDDKRIAAEYRRNVTTAKLFVNMKSSLNLTNSSFQQIQQIQRKCMLLGHASYVRTLHANLLSPADEKKAEESK